MRRRHAPPEVGGRRGTGAPGKTPIPKPEYLDSLIQKDKAIGLHRSKREMFTNQELFELELKYTHWNYAATQAQRKNRDAGDNINAMTAGAWARKGGSICKVHTRLRYRSAPSTAEAQLCLG